MNKKKQIIFLTLIASLGLCAAYCEQLEINLNEGFQAKEIGDMISNLESVKIDVGRSDVLWETFKKLLIQASMQSKDVIAQDGIRALVFSFNRPWMKEAQYKVVGQKVKIQDPLFKNNLFIIVCEFDMKGNGKIRGKGNSIQDYLKTNPNQRVVIVCYFDGKTRMNEVFRTLYQLTMFDNVIDFSFPQE